MPCPAWLGRTGAPAIQRNPGRSTPSDCTDPGPPKSVLIEPIWREANLTQICQNLNGFLYLKRLCRIWPRPKSIQSIGFSGFSPLPPHLNKNHLKSSRFSTKQILLDLSKPNCFVSLKWFVRNLVAATIHTIHRIERIQAPQKSTKIEPPGNQQKWSRK